MAGLLIGMVMPMLANGLVNVDPPKMKHINIQQARDEARRSGIRPVIPYRAPVPYTGGRVRGLFIGINYKGSNAALNGCVNDVHQMLGTLQSIGFPLSECCILVDERNFPNFTDFPTRANMIRYLAWLTTDVRPGDVLFLHYSGHGGQSKAQNDSEEAYDQCLIPLDYQQAGTIIDDDLFALLVRDLPPGVRMTCVFDCCHSATMLDLPFSFIGGRNVDPNSPHLQMKAVRRNNFSNGDVVMFSGCDDAGTSADVGGSGGAGGAATQAFTWLLKNTAGLNFIKILLSTRDILAKKKFKQVPQLTSSKPMDLYKPFSLFGPITVDQQVMHQYVPQQYQQPYPNPMPPPQQQPMPQYNGNPGYAPQQNNYQRPPQQYNNNGGPQYNANPGYPPPNGNPGYPGYPPPNGNPGYPGYPPPNGNPGYPPPNGNPGYPGYPPPNGNPGYPPPNGNPGCPPPQYAQYPPPQQPQNRNNNIGYPGDPSPQQYANYQNYSPRPQEGARVGSDHVY